MEMIITRRTWQYFLKAVSVMGFFLKVMPLPCSEFSIGQILDVENVCEGFKLDRVLICSCK